LKWVIFLFLPIFGVGLLVIGSILWYSWRRVQSFLVQPA